jgi:hypothetical protein
MSTTWDSAPERPQAPPPPPEPGGRREPAATDRAGEQRWEPWTAPVALVSALVIATVGGLIVAIVANLTAGVELDGDTPPGVLLGGTIIQDIGFVGAAIVFARMTGPVWAAQFGLRRTSFWSSVLWIFVLYVAFALFTGIWSQLVEIEDDDVLEQFGADDSAVLLALTGLVVCVAAPLVEEFLFRGYMFTALRNWRGLWPAAIINGILFGGIHLASSPVGAIVPLMVFGFGLCLLYARTGSLYPCIAVHAINNAIAFSVMNDWSWQVPLVVAGSLALCALACLAVERRWPERARTDVLHSA